MNACGTKRGIDLLMLSFFHGTTVPSGPGSPQFRGFIITLRHTTLGRIPLDEWSASCRDLCLTTHIHSQETDIHPPGGFQTRYPTKRAAADPRLRPRGHWWKKCSWWMLSSRGKCFCFSSKCISCTDRQYKLKVNLKPLFKCTLRIACLIHNHCHSTFTPLI